MISTSRAPDNQLIFLNGWCSRTAVWLDLCDSEKDTFDETRILLGVVLMSGGSDLGGDLDPPILNIIGVYRYDLSGGQRVSLIFGMIYISSSLHPLNS